MPIAYCLMPIAPVPCCLLPLAKSSWQLNRYFSLRIPPDLSDPSGGSDSKIKPVR